MLADPTVLDWLSHRAGLRKLQAHPRPYLRKALELNQTGDAFTASFGRKEIKGFIGFADLIGFSTRVKNLPAVEVSSYLKPFLTGIIDLAMSADALVDKTIGDEVMFVLPDMGEDGGAPGVFRMGQLLGGLHDLQRKLGVAYSFRIGLSYGLQLVDLIEGKGYSEWTVIGESVILAKRLLSVPGVDTSNGIGGAFGALAKEVDDQEFRAIPGIIAGFASRMKHRLLDEPPNLRGISEIRCALLLPKEPEEEER